MLCDIGKAFRDDVVRGNLEQFRKPALDVDLQLHRHRGPRGELFERDCEPVAADDRRVQPSEISRSSAREAAISSGPCRSPP